MSKGDGPAAGAAGAGGVAGRAGAIASLLVGVTLLAGGGYALIRQEGLQRLKVVPRVTWEMAKALFKRGVENIDAKDVLVSTAKATAGQGAMRHDGKLVTPIATGTQLKRAMKAVKPSYEQLAERIRLDRVKGSGGREGKNRKARQARLRQKFIEVFVQELQKIRRRG